MSDVTVSYKVKFRKREGSALVAPHDAPGDGPAPAAPANATPRDTAPHVAADAHATARLLALAHRVEREIVAGNLRDYREAAARLGVSHARMSQVSALLLLAPAIQQDILLGRVATTEGGLRRITAAADWIIQRDAASRATLR